MDRECLGGGRQQAQVFGSSRRPARRSWRGDRCPAQGQARVTSPARRTTYTHTHTCARTHNHAHKVRTRARTRSHIHTCLSLQRLAVGSVVVDEVAGQPSLTRWEAVGCARCEDGETYSVLHIHPVCAPTDARMKHACAGRGTLSHTHTHDTHGRTIAHTHEHPAHAYHRRTSTHVCACHSNDVQSTRA